MSLPMPGRPGGSGGTNYQQQLKVIMANLNKEIGNIQGASMKGLINVAIYIRNETEKTAPLTPIDKGNLRSSWFITTASQKVANDQWNKGFRTSPQGTKKVADRDMASGHSRAVAEAKAVLSSMNTANRKFLMMGYSANYAGYVHEFVNPNISWSREGSNAKWFQAHVYANKTRILQIVAETSKFK